METNLIILDLPIDDVKPNPKNPRIIRDEKFLELKQSIKDFPEMVRLRPGVVDENNMVLGGNQRHKALKELGWTVYPCVRAETLTEAQKKEFVIKDNIHYGEWDMLSCEQMERSSFLCEIDPKFCDAIVRRFAKFCEEAGQAFEIKKNGELIDTNTYKLPNG